MPFSRPTLSDLRTQVAQDIAAALAGADPLLRFSVLGVVGEVLSGLAHLHYGYLDWIARQAVPYTAEDEALEAWAALKGIFRVPAARSAGTLVFTGTPGTAIGSGVPLVRGDGAGFATTQAGVIGGGGTVTLTARADADPSGLTGAFGNTPTGSVLTLATAIPGIQSAAVVGAAFTGGSDLEDDDSLRSRMLFSFAEPSHGGSEADYVQWARAVPGVTRAWVPQNTDAGIVRVYVMFDEVNTGSSGFPVGTNGVATDETRDAAATGDQLAVANAIYPVRPVTALVYVMAPTADVVPFTIAGLSGASADLKAAVAAAIRGVFLEYGTLGGTVALSYVESAIAAIAGTAGFVITAPAGNIVSAAGEIPVLGVITWT